MTETAKYSSFRTLTAFSNTSITLSKPLKLLEFKYVPFVKRPRLESRTTDNAPTFQSFVFYKSLSIKLFAIGVIEKIITHVARIA